MLSGFDDSLDQRLKKAEEAEGELLKLQPMAAEAPKLRMQSTTKRRSATIFTLTLFTPTLAGN